MASFAVLILGFPFYLAACGNDDTVPDVRRTAQDVPDTSPGDDPLADDLPAVLRRHLEVQFSEKDWVGDVGEIQSKDGVVDVNVHLDFNRNQQAFDEICTAVAGFVLAADRYPAMQVEVTQNDGTAVVKSPVGVPQCSPIAG